MNDEKLKICELVFNKKYEKYVIFSESPEGEIKYYGENDNKEWDYLFNKEFYGYDKKFIHLFKFQEGKLEWLESYNFETDSVDIPIEITDEVFLAVAKQAHEKNITFNDEVVNINKQYIDGKVTI